MKKKKLIVGLFLVLGIFNSVYLYAYMEANPPECAELVNSVCRSGSSPCYFFLTSGEDRCWYDQGEFYFVGNN